MSIPIRLWILFHLVILFLHQKLIPLLYSKLEFRFSNTHSSRISILNPVLKHLYAFVILIQSFRVHSIHFSILKQWFFFGVNYFFLVTTIFWMSNNNNDHIKADIAFSSIYIRICLWFHALRFSFTVKATKCFNGFNTYTNTLESTYIIYVYIYLYDRNIAWPTGDLLGSTYDETVISKIKHKWKFSSWSTCYNLRIISHNIVFKIW